MSCVARGLGAASSGATAQLIQTIHTDIGENKFLQIPDITFIIMNGNHEDGELF